MFDDDTHRRSQFFQGNFAESLFSASIWESAASIELQHPCIQQPCPVDYPQDDHPGADDFVYRPVMAEQQMTVGGAEKFVLRHEGAAFGKAFKRADLFFQAQDKGGG